MEGLGDALAASGPDRQEKLEAASNALRDELEQLGTKITALALTLPPASLLGYIWGQAFIKRIQSGLNNDDEGKSPGFELLQLALEYLHAVSSGNNGPFPSGVVDEGKAKELLSLFERTQNEDDAVLLGQQFGQ
ncbi:hypothetical protein [Bradyrhizobium sp. AZCC 1610]|uniref:hypothetical protein n=1 Tax=Bradyrhizobium sp. AZCC 1610 TaxID=3117020 RepID=UPI002FF43205